MTVPATLPPHIAERVSDVFGGGPVQSVVPLSGGMVNRAARVNAGGTDLFVKWHEAAPVAMFASEAAGLETLGEALARAIRVPKVVEVGDDYLFLEWVEPAAPRSPADFTARFAEGLATLHRTTTRTGHGREHQPYGFDANGFIGVLQQANTPRVTDWPTFYRDCRLLPQIELARRRGHLTLSREQALLAIVEQLPELLQDLPPESCLIHGDLWSGNFLCSRFNNEDTPFIFDPAAYFAHREVEIAFVELFGGFPPGFVDAYHGAYPLDTSYARRRSLHQLYPLLVHLNYFGESYGLRVDRVCQEYLT